MKHILATLAFYSAHAGLHSFSKTCRATRNAVKALERRGYLKVHWQFNQAEFTGKVFSN